MAIRVMREWFLTIVMAVVFAGTVVVLAFVPHSFNSVATLDDMRNDRTLILVMDAWDEFPWEINKEKATDKEIEQWETWVEWWDTDVQNTIKDKISPFLQYARDSSIPIVFSNMVEQEWSGTISPILKRKTYNEPIINLTADLDAYMRGKGLNTILYVGFATNNCILGKPTGMVAMSKLGYNVVLLEDCSLSGAYQSLSDEEAIALADEYGIVTTSEEVINHFGGDK